MGIDKNPDLSLAFSAYPNPAINTLNLMVKTLIYKNLSCQLYDVNGKLIFDIPVNNILTSIPMETISPGTYLLKVQDEKKLLEALTIIKN